MREQIKSDFYWRKLDDQAKVFSLVSNNRYSSIFRLSVILKDKITPGILQKAVEKALEIYKEFKVKMPKGLFWYYLEQNEKKPIVKIENDYPFKKINTKENNHYLFKVTYFKNKINIDFLHTLTDGNGGKKFFKEIIYRYLELKYPKELGCKEETIFLKNSENAYVRNYRKCKIKREYSKKAYMIKGKQLKKGEVGITHFNIKLQEFLKCTKEQNSSLSIYLIALVTYSIYETYYKTNYQKRPISICVPISLQKYFSTETISNFFSYMMISLNEKKQRKYTFDNILEIVKKEFENKMKIEKIVKTMTSHAGLTNNIFIRLIPLFMKKFIVSIGSLELKRYYTMTVSNIGRIDVEDRYSKYVENFFVILSPDWAEKIKCGICSYEDTLVVTFATILKDNLLENKFKELLTERNITFEIERNEVSVIS